MGPAGRWLLVIVCGATLLWARGWQDLRFLLTIYPLLALLGAAGLDAALRRWQPHVARRAVVGALVAVLCLSTAGRHVARAGDVAGVVLGREPVRGLPGPTPDRLRGHRGPQRPGGPGPGDALPGGRADLVLPPALHPRPGARQPAAVVRPPGGAGGGPCAVLQAEGVSHILLSKVDFWYLEHQDPQDRLRRQLAEFYRFKAAHLELVYEDAWTEVYRGRW